MTDVFISYSRKNTAFARRLIESLNHSGKNSWVDWEGIPLISPNWWREIQQGIESADSFLFITSPDSMASVVCNMELNYAIELGKRIIPLIYQDVATEEAFATIADFTPDPAMNERLGGKDPLAIARSNWQNMSHINWIHFREQDDFDASYAKLITAVETNLDYVRAHTRYLVRAQEWEREAKRQDLLLFGGEIDRAEAWLQQAKDYHSADKRDTTNPPALDLHHLYIETSRQEDIRRRRVLRNLRVGTLIFAGVGVIAFAVAVISWLSSQEAERREAVAITAVALAEVELTAIPITLTPIGGTLQAGATQIVQQEIESQATLGAVNTEVAYAQVTVTHAYKINDIMAVSGNVMIQPDNPSFQIAQMDDLLSRYPDYAQAWNSRGAIYGRQGNYEKAIEDHTQALVLHPDDPIGLTYRGLAHRNLGDYDHALADFNQIIGFDPNYTNAYLNRGLVYLNMGDYDQAEADFLEAIVIDPQDATAYANLGTIYQKRNDPVQSLGYFDQAIAITPLNADYFKDRGISHAMLGAYEQALDDLNHAITLNPRYSEAFYNRGVIYYFLGDYEATQRDFTQAFQFKLSNQVTYFNMAEVSTTIGDYAFAIESYTQAIAMNPNDIDAYLNRGIVYYYLDDFQSALDDFTSVTELNPQHALAFSNRGLIYKHLDDEELALENYNQALALDPQLLLALGNRGDLYFDRGEYALAIADYETGITIDPSYAYAYGRLAESYYQMALAGQDIDPELIGNNYARYIELGGVIEDDLRQTLEDDFNIILPATD